MNLSAMDSPLNFIMLFVVLASAFVVVMYLIRVIRHKKDPLRWALLTVLVAMLGGNVVVFLRALHIFPETWISVAVRSLSTIGLIWLAWPLLCDTWGEVRQNFCFGHKKRES